MPKTGLIPATWQVPKIFRDRLGKEAGRQRTMVADGHLLLVLHEPPERAHGERHGRTFWRQPDGTWLSNSMGSGVGALVKHLNEFAEKIDQLDRAEQQADNASDYFLMLESLTPLLRAIRNLHKALQDARTNAAEDRDLINLRDRAYAMERRAELLLQDAKMSLDYRMAKQAEVQARSSHQMAVSAHRLNVLAAFFFPIATLASVLGVNLQHGLEDQPAPWTFLIVMSIGLGLGFVLQWFIRGANTQAR